MNHRARVVDMKMLSALLTSNPSRRCRSSTSWGCSVCSMGSEGAPSRAGRRWPSGPPTSTGTGQLAARAGSSARLGAHPPAGAHTGAAHGAPQTRCTRPAPPPSPPPQMCTGCGPPRWSSAAAARRGRPGGEGRGSNSGGGQGMAAWAGGGTFCEPASGAVSPSCFLQENQPAPPRCSGRVRGLPWPAASAAPPGPAPPCCKCSPTSLHPAPQNMRTLVTPPSAFSTNPLPARKSFNSAQWGQGGCGQWREAQQSCPLGCVRMCNLLPPCQGASHACGGHSSYRRCRAAHTVGERLRWCG